MFQFKFKSKEDKSLWDSLPFWNSFLYNNEIKNIYKICTHKFDKFGSKLDDNSTKGYTGLARMVLPPRNIYNNERIILYLRDGCVVELKFFNLNGELSGHHKYKDGKKDGESMRYDWLNYEKEIINYKDGKRHGLNTVFYPHGQKKSQVNFIDGRREGIDTSWYENGIKKSEVYYQNGRQLSHLMDLVRYERHNS